MRAADASALPKQGAARLFMPAGAHGPILLVTHNFDVIKTYNNSNAYVLAVGLLGDAIVADGRLRTPWPTKEHALTRDELKVVQTQLKSQGFGIGDIDGRAGPKLEQAIRAFQFTHALTPDGYASPALLHAPEGRARERARPRPGGAAQRRARRRRQGRGQWHRRLLLASVRRAAAAAAERDPAAPTPRRGRRRRVARKPHKRTAPRETKEAREPSAPVAPATPPPTASKFVYVLGDSLAISAADGMAGDLQSHPDIGVVDRARDASGLVRDDYFDWPKAARELVGVKPQPRRTKTPRT